jgi:hypothetical protein
MSAKERNISLEKTDETRQNERNAYTADGNFSPIQNNAPREKKGFFETVIFDITDTFSKIAALLTKKETIKENVERFNLRYDKTNEFDEEIPDGVVFMFGKDEGKKLPVSAILLIIGFSAMWLLTFIIGFFNINI